MKPLIGSFFRALAYCTHPRVVLLSILPFLIVAGATFGLAWFYWDVAVDAVRMGLFSWQLLDGFANWLQRLGLGDFRAMLGPLVVVFLALPVVVVASLLFVAWLMTPAIARYVGGRRFPALQRRHGGSWFGSMAWAIFHTGAALFALALSIPLWFVPPFVLLIPPLIWGWLTYKVLAYDVLSDYATREERRELLGRLWPGLLTMGVVSGYLATLPSMVFTLHAISLVFAPWLAFLVVWLYALIFAFGSLWFAHYLLAELTALRSSPNEHSSEDGRSTAGPLPVPDDLPRVVHANLPRQEPGAGGAPGVTNGMS